MLFNELNPSAKVSFWPCFSWWFSFLHTLPLNWREGSAFHYALPTCHGNIVPCQGSAVALLHCWAGLKRVSPVPFLVGVWSLLWLVCNRGILSRGYRKMIWRHWLSTPCCAHGNGLYGQWRKYIRIRWIHWTDEFIYVNSYMWIHLLDEFMWNPYRFLISSIGLTNFLS